MKETTPRPETDNTETERDLEVVRERVKVALRAVGRSQRDLEEAAGYSTGYLSKIFSGDRPLKASTIRVLATALANLRATISEEELVAGTYYASVLKVGDDAPAEVVFASLTAQLDEQRLRVAELEAAKVAAEERAVAAERMAASLDNRLTDAERRAAQAEINSKRDAERAAHGEAALQHERNQRLEAEQRAARLRVRIELPTAVTAEDKEYIQALREHGVTDWMSYARHLERQRHALKGELAKERGKPGWGTAAFVGLVIAGVGAAVVGSGEKKGLL